MSGLIASRTKKRGEELNYMTEGLSDMFDKLGDRKFMMDEA